MSLNNFMTIVVGAVVLALLYGVVISAGSRTKLKAERITYFSFSFLLGNDIRNENIA
jgi:hypothetical protein